MDIQDMLVIDPGTAEGVFSDYVAHIADTGIQPLTSDYRFKEEHSKRRAKQVLCSRGRWRDRDGEELTLIEAAELHGFEKTEFADEAPDTVCAKCWKEALEIKEKLADIQAADIQLGDTGYLMRWKEKGKARSNWCDIVVHPKATFEEIDTHLVHYFGIGDFHLRMYGLEDEYDDSSIGILPDRQYEKAGTPDQTSASEITIGTVGERYRLWKDDRLSLVYDLGMPSRRFYCIIKEVLSEDDIKEYRKESDNRSGSEHIFFLQQN